MYVMEKKIDKEQTEKAKRRKELTVANKKKKELQRVAEQMVQAADKKAKEADEKKKDTVGMKALLWESIASRDKSKRIMEKDLPAQEKAIKEMEQKLEGLD